MTKFHCYSRNESMGGCKTQCDYCKKHFHPLPRLTKHYKFSVIANQDSENIKFYAPQHLIKQLQDLKRKDPDTLKKALGELMLSKI